MRTHLIFIKTLRLLCISFLLTILSCGSYQGVSYYGLDGIYGDPITPKTEQIPSSKRGENLYYKDYFGNLADDYTSLEDSENQSFTDTDNYTGYQSNGNASVNTQAPWGDNTSKTEIYYINNNPWGYFNNGWAFNRGFFNPFFDPFWGGFYGPGFRNFYNPWGFNFYTPFYGYNFPYSFGYPFRSRYFNGRFEFSGNNMGYSYSGYSRGNDVYSKSNSTRGGRFSQVNSNNNVNRNQTNSSGNFQGSSSNNKRYNVGRRSESTNYTKNNPSTSRNNTEKTSSSRGSRNNYSSRRSSYESTSRSSTNYGSSRYSSYSSGRSYLSSPSYNSRSRNSSGSSRSSGSRGR